MGMSQSRSDSVEVESVYLKRILEAREKLTGWERVKLIFKKDEYGGFSPEIQRVLTGFLLGITIGGFIGAMGRGRLAHQNFMRSNMHEVFETPLQAKRKLQDSVTLGMFSGAYRVGWRVGAFTSMYLTVSSLTSTYRGKMGILDSVAGGGGAGFCYKFAQGPKAAVAGGTIGLGLGLIAGCMSWGVFKLTGQTMDQANLSYYKYLAQQETKEIKNIHKTREQLNKLEGDIREDDYNLTSLHDKLVKQLKIQRVWEAADAEADESSSDSQEGKAEESSPSEKSNVHESTETSTNESISNNNKSTGKAKVEKT